MRRPRILLEGVGSVGGVIAGELLARGHDVTLVTGNPAITAALNGAGLTLTTPTRTVTVAAPATTTIDELDAGARFDCAYLLMMAGGVAAAATAPRLCADGYVVSFQNGVVGEIIAAHCGDDRIINASVAFGASLVTPGHYHLTRPGHITIGEPDGRETARLVALQCTLADATETRISNNIAGVLWAKLAWNCAVSALCAVSGLLLGEVLADIRGQSLFLLTYREALDTAQAHGVVLERAVIEHEHYYLPCNADRALRATRFAAVAELGRRYAEVKPSALQTLLRGRTTEVAYLNGYLADQAQAIGLATPMNVALVKMIHEIEQGHRRLDRANLAGLVERVAAFAAVARAA